jgi:hypothetical protein
MGGFWTGGTKRKKRYDDPSGKTNCISAGEHTPFVQLEEGTSILYSRLDVHFCPNGPTTEPKV